MKTEIQIIFSGYKYVCRKKIVLDLVVVSVLLEDFYILTGLELENFFVRNSFLFNGLLEVLEI